MDEPSTGAARPTARDVRPSIKDVAARAGVSFQTVSKVLRGQGTVSDATRARIQEAADALGYVPDEVARSLVRQRTQTLGVVVGDLSDHVVARFVPGVEQEARRHDYGTFIVNLPTDPADGERSVRSLLSRRVDGIVAAAPQLEEDARLGRLLERVPTVAIHSVLGQDIPQVGSDQRETGRVATDHLLSLGRRRIGMVTGLATRHVTSSRTTGWAAAHADHGVTQDDDATEEGDWTPAGGHSAVRRLLRRRPDLDAIFVHNDLMAVGVLRALAEDDRRVPDEVAVVACDDIAVAAFTTPSLSTIRLPFVETGAEAVRLLMELLDEAIDDHEVRLLPSQLQCRESCGCRDTRETPG